MNMLAPKSVSDTQQATAREGRCVLAQGLGFGLGMAPRDTRDQNRGGFVIQNHNSAASIRIERGIRLLLKEYTDLTC